MNSQESNQNLDIGYRTGSAVTFLTGLLFVGGSAFVIDANVAHANKNGISLLESDHLLVNLGAGGLLALAAYFGLRGLAHAFTGKNARDRSNGEEKDVVATH